MSYQVIARKWRPQAFEEVTGQEHITRTLRNALEYDRLHHAYLFSGARGVGKTTTARLLAKALNCHKTETPNLYPCSSSDPAACASCIEISESRSMDVLEIDAASHTGIDDVRETIIENINVNPARDRFKVFIIDEVHQLSRPAFNALLKTLEEPPPNVVFIMATTELHKVPDTILSRCQQFEFRTIPPQKIFERLKLIANAEKIDVSDVALREIARSGEGSMRDAQSNFDQVISFSGEKIGVSDVTDALGMAGTEMLTRTVSAVAAKDAKVILAVVEDLISRGQDLRNFCRDLLGLLRDLLVFKVGGQDTELIDRSVLTTEELRHLSGLFSETDLLRFFNSLAETESKLKDATQPRYLVEIGLVRLIEIRRAAPIESLLERLATLEAALRSNEANVPLPDKSSAAGASGSSEKKTLKSEPAATSEVQPTEPPFVAEESPVPDTGITSQTLSVDFDTPQIPAFGIDLSLLESLPVKLAPIAPEELEHIEDPWLDNAFERKLAWSGDDLFPIRGASSLAEMLAGATAKTESGSHGSNGNVSSAAESGIPTFAPPTNDAKHVPLPELPENPTEEQILAYANEHPSVKKVMKIFRAKLVAVERPRPPEAG